MLIASSELNEQQEQQEPNDRMKAQTGTNILGHFYATLPFVTISGVY